MTEAEWVACDDPVSLLLALGTIATDRKLRLLAASVLRLSLGEYPEDWDITKEHAALISWCEGLADGTETHAHFDGRTETRLRYSRCEEAHSGCGEAGGSTGAGLLAKPGVLGRPQPPGNGNRDGVSAATLSISFYASAWRRRPSMSSVTPGG